MLTAEIIEEPPQAAVVAADGAVGLAIALLLEASGVAAPCVGNLAEVFVQRSHGLAAVIIDWSLLQRAALGPIAELRAQGWQGLFIVMIEDDQVPLALLAAEFGRYEVLAKPFFADDLLALLPQIMGAGGPAEPRLLER